MLFKTNTTHLIHIQKKTKKKNEEGEKKILQDLENGPR